MITYQLLRLVKNRTEFVILCTFSISSQYALPHMSYMHMWLSQCRNKNRWGLLWCQSVHCQMFPYLKVHVKTETILILFTWKCIICFSVFLHNYILTYVFTIKYLPVLRVLHMCVDLHACKDAGMRVATF